MYRYCGAGLGNLLQEFNEETLHIALETLTVVIKADAQAAAAWEHRVSPAVLQVWAAHVADPLIALDSTDVLQALAANPAALPSLQVGCPIPFLPCHWSCSGILALIWLSGWLPCTLQTCCKRWLFGSACRRALLFLLLPHE